MGFYENKMQANDFIEKMAKTNVSTKAAIIYAITKKYGFGERFVNKYLENLYNLGYIKFDGDNIIWTKNKDE